MARSGKVAKRIRGALLKTLVACALALMPVQAYADASVSKADGDESDLSMRRTYEPRDEYVSRTMDEALIPAREDASPLAALSALFGMDANRCTDSGHTLYIKSTLFDVAAAGEDRTLDAIYARDDWMGIIAAQYDASADLLDLGEGSDHLIAVACESVQNGLGSPTDHVFTMMTNDGDIVEGCTFDAHTGLAYLPKALFERDGADAPFACQLQLLLPTDFQEEQTCQTDVTIACGDFRVTPAPDAPITSPALDVTTTIPVADPATAGHIALSDIHVRLNGSEEEMELIEGQSASWDPATGMLEIAASPRTVLSAEVRTDAPSLLDLFAAPAHATSSSSLAYVPNVVFDSLNLDTLTPGRTLPFGTYINYWWPNPKPDDLHWNACISTGPYCYSWIDDPTSLYEYIAWAEGASWDDIAARGVSSFLFDPSAGQAARHYFNYVFEFGDFTIEDQSFHSERWPVNTPYNTGYGTANFGLQCSHARNPVGNGVSPDDCYGQMALRVLDVCTEAARPYVVLGFVGPSIANQPGVGIYKFEVLPSGDIEIAKTSSAPELSAHGPNYRFEGITYDVFADAACTSLACSIALDANGHGTSKRLKDGTYYVRENASSTQGSGFAHSSTIHTVTVKAGETARVDAADVPQSYDADLIIRKVDAVTANSTPQGDATLADALFEVRHYRELFAEAKGASGLTPDRVWQLKTDESGCVLLDEDHLASGDALFRTGSGDACLPLGTVTMQEVSAPEGYRIDPEVRVIPLRAQGASETIAFTQAQTVPQDIMRGGMRIEKRDAESGSTEPLGAASLDGTTFQIRNASAQAVCVDGVMFGPGEVVARITSEGGSARTGSDALPFGTYEVQEVAAGSGYLASDAVVRTFQIEHDGQMVSLSHERACHDQVKRGDLDFRKVLETDQSRLARVPFMLESLTTGERHVLASDGNGIVSTSAQWHPHTHKTNANDHLLDAVPGGGMAEGSDAEDAPVDGAREVDPDAGIWFGLTADGDTTAPDDSLGALPYDTYALTELRAKANEGLDLIKLDAITVTAHGLSVPLGDIEDRVTPPATITTYAKSATDSSKHIFPVRDARITDRVDYGNLAPGNPYQIKGRLMDAASGDAVKDSTGQPVTSTADLTPAIPSGSCEVAFTFDAFAYAGERLVCFEEVIDLVTGEVVASHEDMSDQGQSVDVLAPHINTYALDRVTDEKDIIASASAKIEDRVSYSGLEEGAEYTLTGSLMRKVGAESGGGAEPVLDAEGDAIASTIAFTPLASIGTTAVTFSFDATGMPDGAELVVYETLTRDGKDLVVHESPENDAQTVVVRTPRISTHAFDAQTGEDCTPPSPELTITDEVTYEHLAPGSTYSLFGTVMLVTEGASGHLAAEPLCDAAGNKVAASIQFAPESPSGTVMLDLAVDASTLPGKRLVIYERLVADGSIVATHEDAASESQTVWISNPEEPAPPARSPRALPQTGDGAPLAPAIIFSGLALALSLTVAYHVRKQHAATRIPSKLNSMGGTR